MIEICQAMVLLNGAGFIHCDLKLENIMVEFKAEKPVVKVIDFGSTFELKYGLPKVVTPAPLRPSLPSTCRPNCFPSWRAGRRTTRC
jgi:serine/threonine protein kinase